MKQASNIQKNEMKVLRLLRSRNIPHKSCLDPTSPFSTFHPSLLAIRTNRRRILLFLNPFFDFLFRKCTSSLYPRSKRINEWVSDRHERNTLEKERIYYELFPVQSSPPLPSGRRVRLPSFRLPQEHKWSAFDFRSLHLSTFWPIIMMLVYDSLSLRGKGTIKSGNERILEYIQDKYQTIGIKTRMRMEMISCGKNRKKEIAQERRWINLRCSICHWILIRILSPLVT